MSWALLHRAGACMRPPRRVPVSGYVWINTRTLDPTTPGGAGTSSPSALTDALDPFSCAFGAAVADLLTWCIDRRLLAFAAPVSAVAIEPTICTRPCGGFRVLTSLGDRITLTSPALPPELFHGLDEPAMAVLAVVVEAADRSCRELLHDATRLARVAS